MAPINQITSIDEGHSLPHHLDGLRNGLRCLSHPSAIASIVILMVNDHILKVFVPSALTGKLSDFAGLYFFPFLLAIPLSLLFDRSGRRQRTIGGLSILLTASLFTMIKISPSVNAAPTDLIALLILIPSWRLWNQDSARPPTSYAWLVLGVASMATMATSCPPIDVISRIVVHEGVIYTSSQEFYTVASYDLGLTWQDPTDYPDGVFEQLDPMEELPKTVCFPQNPSQCYRVLGDGVVESSKDRGSSWEIAWQVPPGRRKLMDRIAKSWLCGKRIDLGPYDIAVVGPSTVVVAMGNEGILHLGEDGVWSRRGVGSAIPTPLSVRTLFEIFRVLSAELGTLLFGAFLGWMVLNVLYGVFVIRRLSPETPDQGPDWILAPLTIAMRNALLILVGVIALAWLANAFNALGTISLILLILIPVALLVGYLHTWRRLKSAVPNAESTGKALPAFFILSLGGFGFGFAPFVLWSIDMIGHYQTAQQFSIALSLVAVIIAALVLRTLARKTITVGDSIEASPPSTM
jgi:hypothetical protein